MTFDPAAAKNQYEEAQDIEATICFLEHSRHTHERWAEWLDAGGQASQDLGDLEHHERCVLEYDHILDVVAGLPAALEALEEARETVVQLRDIARTVVANGYGSPGFAHEARIRTARADAILGESE